MVVRKKKMRSSKLRSKSISRTKKDNLYSYEFDVNWRLKSDWSSDSPENLQDVVFEWYKIHAEDIKLIYNVTKITFSKTSSHSKFHVKVKCKDKPLKKSDMEMISTPDEDGNYPIEYNGKNWLVSGVISNFKKL